MTDNFTKITEIGYPIDNRIGIYMDPGLHNLKEMGVVT